MRNGFCPLLVVRLLLALLRASGFTLAGSRLAEGEGKAGILRAISSAEAFLPLAIILRILGLESGRYHAWRRAENACLDRILAQVEVAFSNSLIEAYWRSLKHQWLFLNTLDSVARVRALVEFYVNEHTKKMPHPALSGQTPDEMFFGTSANMPEELALARSNARAVRMAVNRAMSCHCCLGQQATLPEAQIPP